MQPMELKVVEQKPLKRIYFNFLAICATITVGSLILFLTGFGFFQYALWAIKLKDIFLLMVICLAGMFFFYQQAQRKKLLQISSFEDRIRFYETFYRNRNWWQVFSCVISCFLLLLTHRLIFLAFCLFDLITMLIAYPSPEMIRKDLGDEEIIVN
jgi:hypothetical protein